MPRPSLAAIQLRHLHKNYMYGRANVEKIMAAGQGEWLKRLLADAGMTSMDPADVAEAMEKRQLEKAKLHIMRLLGECDSFRGPVSFEFVDTQTPNGFAAWHPDDDSHAIGLDPSMWAVFSALTFAAGFAEMTKNPAVLIDAARAHAISAFLKGANPPSEVEEVSLRMHRNAPPILRELESLSESFYVTFLLAHEVAHIELGHLRAADTKRMQFDPASAAIPISALDWEKEFAADRWALDAMLRIAAWDNVQRTLAVTLPVIYFDLAALLETMYAPTKDIGRVLRATHPPPRERANRCFQWRATHREIPPDDLMRWLVNIGHYVRSLLPSEDS